MNKIDESGIMAKTLLRLNDEPCVYYNETQVHRTLISHINNFMDILERVYYEWSNYADMIFLPNKQVFTVKSLKGDLRIMSCIVNNGKEELIKVVKVIGTNEEERVVKDKISVGKALLIHPTDNFVEAIFDVCSLSSFKAAAMSVLAFKHLTNFGDHTIGIIGCGRIGFYMSCILYHWLGVRKIMVMDTNKSHIKGFKEVLRSLIHGQIKEETLNGLCTSCSALFLATDSKSPIISADNAKRIHFIASVGADADNLSEVDSSLIKGRQLITDSRDNIHFGDLKRWKSAGLITKDKLIELQEIMNHKKDTNKAKLFISTGIAVPDAIVCHFLYEHLKNEGTRLA